mmetsp:Transcript_1250/g.2306  ORF Transcript_1250/g.2306 Transcript_1250/m.2306 type:complete len:201 (-) Transcript_1250:129-731(-)
MNSTFLFRNLIDSLFFDFLTNSGFNSLVFFFGNSFSHFTIRRISTKDIGIEKGHSDECHGDNFSKQIVIGIGHRCHEEVIEKSVERIKEKPKIEGNNDANILELCFQTTHEQSTACGVDCQDPVGKRRKRRHEYNRTCHEGNSDTHVGKTHHENDSWQIGIVGRACIRSRRRGSGSLISGNFKRFCFCGWRRSCCTTFIW